MDRTVDLWIEEFERDPYELATTLPTRPFILGRKGDPIGRSQRHARRNLIVFRHNFTIDEWWPNAIDALMTSLGGWDEVKLLIERLQPKEGPLVQFNLPVCGSPHQENNWIEPAMLARLAEHGLAIGFEFGNYSSDETK